MRVTVIEPPPPIVTPVEIPGDHAADDVAVAALISAVTAGIAGPDGWLGRSLGPQTLELALSCWPDGFVRLPCPPVISVLSVSYVDSAGALVTVNDSAWQAEGGEFWMRSSFAPPELGDVPRPVRIRYRAGYDGNPVDEGGTGRVPEQARQAIVLSVHAMKALRRDDLFLKVDEVQDVGRREWVISDQAGRIIEATAGRLLQGLRVYS